MRNSFWIILIAFNFTYNKYYKPNTSFEAESIFLYVMKDDSIAFRDSISKYIKSEKTFYSKPILLFDSVGGNSREPFFPQPRIHKKIIKILIFFIT